MKRFLALCLTLVLVIGVMPLRGADAASMTATVTGGWLKLRQAPNSNAAVINSYYTGTVVTILGSSGNWYYVKTPDGKTGYMSKDYLKLNADSGSENAPAGNLNITAWVISQDGQPVRMRSGPSTSYSVVGHVPVGAQVTILAKGTNWFQISYNGQIGYMMSQYLTTTPTGPSTPSTGLYTDWVISPNGRTVNLRSGPGTDYAVIGSYSVGTQVTVLSKGATWCYVQIGTRVGYMMTMYLSVSSGTGTGAQPTTPPSTTSYTAWVTSQDGNGVMLRAGAGTSYTVISTLPVGTQVTVLQHGSTWDRVRVGAVEGYIMNRYLTTVNPNQTPATPPAGGYIASVYADNGYPVKMRTGPGTNYPEIARLPVGTLVTVVSEINGWCYIIYNGQYGYMDKTFLRATSTEGTTVTAVTLNTLSPAPGEVLTATVTPAGATVNYAWIDGLGNVLGSGASYLVQATDVGKQIAVRVAGTGAYSGTAVSPYATVVASKQALTGVTISGTVAVGQTITAVVTPSGATATYEWYRTDGVRTELVGSGASYQVKAEDAAKGLCCKATGDGAYTGSVFSAWELVAGAATQPTVTPLIGVTVNGSAVVGQTLTAAVNPVGATANYEWYRTDGVNMELVGSSSSYLVKAEDAGRGLCCKATGLANYTGTVFSTWVLVAGTATNPTDPPAPTDTPAPTEVTGVTISGRAVVGQTLTASATPAGVAVVYEWYRTLGAGMELIATGATYTVKAEDAGKGICCRATGKDGVTGSVYSTWILVAGGTTPTTPPTAQPTEQPTIPIISVNVSGTPAVGHTLTASLLPEGATANLSWIREDGKTVGTGATYTVQAEDVGMRVCCMAEGTGRYYRVIASVWQVIANPEEDAAETEKPSDTPEMTDPADAQAETQAETDPAEAQTEAPAETDAVDTPETPETEQPQPEVDPAASEAPAAA